ncbi:MAG: hypothetical protein NZ899_09255 [Thermoguttaceae bacterium]|nr:hypothetical protein [Thermoguttaceae bacterium]MDW8079360.1 hypothetical protein [Thermoguttaceae bacterium]
MSLFGDPRYQWRETYFVLFRSERRPTLAKMERALRRLNPSFTLLNQTADEQGRFQSLTLIAPDDFAGLDISYMEGQEVIDETEELIEQLAATESSPEDRQRLKQLTRMDARFDVYHFEEISEEEFDDEEDREELLDPGALLSVLELLAKMTGGIVVDPQSGTLF